MLNVSAESKNKSTGDSIAVLDLLSVYMTRSNLLAFQMKFFVSFFRTHVPRVIRVVKRKNSLRKKLLIPR